MSKPYFRLWIIRVIMLMVGLTIAHLGVTLFIQANGADPFNVFIQGLYSIIPWDWAPIDVTAGMVHIAVSLLIVGVLLVVDRSYIRIGTLLCMVFGGPIIDMFTYLLTPIIHPKSELWWRLIVMALGCVILAFGMTIVIQSQAGTGPNDLVGVVISDKTGWKFGFVRVAVDVVFAGVGLALDGPLGIGTLICAALVGPTAQLVMPLSRRICKCCNTEK